MISSGFFTSGSLIESLIHVSNELSTNSMENSTFLQDKNISTMRRKIKILSFLFEEIQEEDGNHPLSPSSILCLTEIFSVMRRIKFLIEGCERGSRLWGLLQLDFVSNQFYVLVKEMGRALEILPLNLLQISTDIREQVELVHDQATRVQLFVDPQEIEIREELLQLMNNNNEKKCRKKVGFDDVNKIKELFSSIGMRSLMDYEDEISKLEDEVVKQAGTGGLIAVSNINNLISLVLFSKSMIFTDEESEKIRQEIKKKFGPSNYKKLDYSLSSSSLVNIIPDEFRCPISLDLMKDPVILASGHTYDRASISQWIDSGNQKCPKSGQRLIHMALIPNYALKSLMQQWSQENNFPLYELAGLEEGSKSKGKRSENALDHISATKIASDAVKMTAEFLVGKLATGSPKIQRQATYELRLLAKTGAENRRIIAEAGAIPFLVALLNSNDPRTQENAVTALLNLSIFNNNKILIIAAGAIDNIVRVLELGRTMEARANAAAAIFSLSMVDDFKLIIGERPRAIPGLVRLLKEGTSAGKKDAATALFNLALHNANKLSIVVSGAVPLLIELLTDDKAGITDDALQVLSLVLGCYEGLEEIRRSKNVVPLLIDLLRFGSCKGKESSVTLLLGLCKDGGEDVRRHLLLNSGSIPALRSLAEDGSLRARRKADALLRLLDRWSSQAHNLVQWKNII